MEASRLGLASGDWLVANCGKYPSERNCRLVLMGPADQRQDLIDAAVAHAVKHHGHEDSPQLREELGKFLETVRL
jgi:hypothetical protein